MRLTFHAASLALAFSAAPAFAQGDDDCTMAQAIMGTGVFAFDNSAATTDGVPDALCNAFGTSDIDNDVWFSWTAPNDGNFTITTCNQTSIDSKLAVLDGSCAGAVLACNDDSCGLQSTIGFDAVGSQAYLLRVGTFPGALGGAGTITITENVPTLNPANGNHYLAVPEIGILWTDAKVAAEASSFMGVQGHLATVTDAAEDDWIWANLDGGNGQNMEEYWLGGFQDLNSMSYSEPGGGWTWVTGEPWAFTDWWPGEPNDSPAPEDYVIYMPFGLSSTGQWNDGRNDHWSIRGYIVEYDTGTGLGDNYCINVVNSTGSGAEMSATGTLSIATNNLALHAGPVPNQPGLFFYGPTQLQQPFGNGFLCITGNLVRLDVVFASANQMSFAIDYPNLPSLGQVTAGDTRFFQAWYRDPAAGGAFFNLSDGLELTFEP